MPRASLRLLPALALSALVALPTAGAQGAAEGPAFAGALSRTVASPRASAARPAAAEVAPAEPGASALPYRASQRFDRPTAAEAAPVFYAVRGGVPLYAAPGDARPTTHRLGFRESVRVLAQEGAWSLVQLGRTEGYVESASLSNVWLRMDKSDRTLYVYGGPELLRALPADVSAGEGDKTVRGTLGDRDTYRMPEGTYYICRLNPNSEYHRAFVVSYPNREDAARGLQDGVISRAEYDAIARAEANFEAPPMGTALGGLIEVHGSGSGRQRAWTRGCIALRNVHIDWLWGFLEVGAPLVIEE